MLNLLHPKPLPNPSPYPLPSPPLFAPGWTSCFSFSLPEHPPQQLLALTAESYLMYVLLLVNAIWWLEMGRKPRERQPPCGPLASVQPLPWCSRDLSCDRGSHSALQGLMPDEEPPPQSAWPLPGQPGCRVGPLQLPPPRAWHLVTPLSHGALSLGGEAEGGPRALLFPNQQQH